jgi:hypothetical protein
VESAFRRTHNYQTAVGQYVQRALNTDSRSKRALAIGVACAAMAIVLASVRLTSSTRSSGTPVIKTRPVETAASEPVIPRLLTLERRIPAPITARNLFAFRTAPPVAAVAPAAPPVERQEPIASPPPGLTLIGIAADSRQQDAIRTAIISGASELFLAREGDSVTPRYQVSRIFDDAAELIETGSGAPLRLALR